jgi:hypothetical protein
MINQAVATSSFFQSANEPSFVYSGWHHQSRHQSSPTAMNHRSSTTSSAATNDVIGTQIRDYRVMSPKDSCDQHVEYQGVNYDEDYDEYNLHIAPHLVTNRCEQRLNSLDDALGHKDLYSLSDGDHQSISSYLWNQDAEMRPVEWFHNAVVPESPSTEDCVTNSVDEGEISFGM